MIVIATNFIITIINAFSTYYYLVFIIIHQTYHYHYHNILLFTLYHCKKEKHYI